MEKIFTKDRKIAYYASKLSDNIMETPEGYLICKNVPVARTGVQEYLGQELGLTDKYDEYIKIYREEDEVFNPAAIASFEGKPYTDEHPSDMVDVNNISIHGKGHVQNVRRSTEEPDLLLADIVVTDTQTISEIKNKVKREISCGYDCYYVPYKDGYKQVEIRGNHIALVSKGRAGSRVSIHDNIMERKKPMAKKNILAAMLKAFAKDAEPEDVAEAMEAIKAKDADSEVEEKKEEVIEKKEEKDADPLADLASRLDAMEAKLEKLYSAEAKEGHEELDADPEEEGPKEEISEEDAEVLDDEPEEEEEEKEVIMSKDSFNALKSAICRIRSTSDRKPVVDAFNKAFFQKKSSKNVYDNIMKLSAKHKTANDSAPAVDLAELGKKIAAKYNPHYMENK